MESTWASGATELLRHADSHINLKTAFDKRIAFISIDNCVENIIRTCLSLPSKKSGFRAPRKEVDEAGNSFPKLLSILFKYASSKLVGIEETDIEHYHRIRNTLYHDGTGLSVDEEYLIAYRDIAGVLLNNLFGVSIKPSPSDSDSLGKLIINWNTIEREIKEKLEASGAHGTYKWEEAFSKGILQPKDVQLLTELRMARNRLVHSKDIDKEDIKYWLDVSEKYLPKIRSISISPKIIDKNSFEQNGTAASSPASVSVTYQSVNISSEVHTYSLSVTVKLLQTPDQDFYRISFLWPTIIPIIKINGFEEGEEKNINGHKFTEYGLFVEKRLWPGQAMKIIGGKANAVLEYEINDKVHSFLTNNRTILYYTLFLQSWQPVQGEIGFEMLNKY